MKRVAGLIGGNQKAESYKTLRLSLQVKIVPKALPLFWQSGPSRVQ